MSASQICKFVALPAILKAKMRRAKMPQQRTGVLLLSMCAASKVVDLAVRAGRRSTLRRLRVIIVNVRQKIADLAPDPAVEKGAAMAQPRGGRRACKTESREIKKKIKKEKSHILNISDRDSRVVMVKCVLKCMELLKKTFNRFIDCLRLFRK
jgi:predicted AAA+ superfamily ATPase